ncbi:MAG: RsmB/NOP family class I SAM-dependent RNA methyltransferase [Cytophaga sp.]|uniref:RsmB/NOP family class I SAM-dependent RNA methyltransferase n=1 Tax=Cytophaga sp. TaxID=29535 RepID=UPI003F81BA27
MKLHPNIIQSIIVSLKKIFTEGAYADDVIRNLLQSNPKWGSRDRRFIAGTLYSIVRWRRRYEFVVNTSATDPQRFEKIVAAYLYDIYKSEIETPLPAAVDPADFSTRSFEALTNRAVHASIEDWMDILGEQQLGKERWERELEFLNTEADVFIRVNTVKHNAKQVQQVLEKEGVATEAFGTLNETLKLKERKPLQRLASYLNGYYEVQDVGSQMIAHYLSPQPKATVIDACAGAGGKTLHIAALMQNKGKIISMDIEAPKLKELERRALRAGVTCIQTKPIKENTIAGFKNAADFLLLDVPCSGIGVLRRNPDDKWKLTKDRIDTLVHVQQQILQEYSTMLKPGGILVYATCSILPAENDNQIDLFLKTNGNFQLEKKQTIYPSEGGDGYFMARLVKR